MTDLAPTVESLQALDRALAEATLPLRLQSVAAARAVTTELRNQITDYLLPRLSKLDAPLIAVIGGSTGSGKSTITNSLVGIDVSPAGVLRPTTRAPVLICHPTDEEWFASSEVLPDLPRVTGDNDATGTVLRIQPTDTFEAGLALIDAPDIDSIEEANRELATQLLAAADLWLFTTTAVRYADAVPWDFLHRAQARGTALAIIINRVPPGAAAEIVPHLESMLVEAGLPEVPLFAIDESDLVDQRLEPASVEELKAILTDLATNADRRAEIVRRTLDGALASIPERANQTLAASRQQDAATAELREALEGSYQRAREALDHDLQGGALLRGEVLERWQELIGTAELMRAVQSRISRIRDRIGSFIRGRQADTAEVQGEITSTLERLLLDQADAVALEVVTAWRQLPGGKQVLGDDRTLETASAQLRTSIGSEIRAWQDDILGLVTELGSGKRTTARILALGVNSIGVALMIVIFAQTGGITGGEVAVAGGTAAVSQGLLNAVFGEQAVRDLSIKARSLLLDRVGSLLEIDANRFRTKLWGTVPGPETTQALFEAIAHFEAAQNASSR